MLKYEEALIMKYKIGDEVRIKGVIYKIVKIEFGVYYVAGGGYINEKDIEEIKIKENPTK